MWEGRLLLRRHAFGVGGVEWALPLWSQWVRTRKAGQAGARDCSRMGEHEAGVSAGLEDKAQASRIRGGHGGRICRVWRARRGAVPEG